MENWTEETTKNWAELCEEEGKIKREAAEFQRFVYAALNGEIASALDTTMEENVEEERNWQAVSVRDEIALKKKLEKENEELYTKIKKLRNENDIIKENNNHLRSTIVQFLDREEQYKRQLDSYWVMEADLGKIRNAIGEIQFNKIVEGDK